MTGLKQELRPFDTRFYLSSYNARLHIQETLKLFLSWFNLLEMQNESDKYQLLIAWIFQRMRR